MNFSRQFHLSPKPSQNELICSMLGLEAMKLITIEQVPAGQRLDLFRRIRNVVREEEIEIVLKEDKETSRYFK